LAPQVISVLRKKYAVGLFWQPLPAAQNPRVYAKDLTKSVVEKYNLFAEYRAMVGLGARKFDHRVGMPVAAAEVMDAFAEFSSFLAVFEISGKYWLCAVRNGIILEDILFDNDADARGEYFRLAAIPDWGAVFAPGDWGAPRAVEKHIEDIISGDVKCNLHPISHFFRDILSVVVLMVFLLGLAWFFKDPISVMFSKKPQVSEINAELAAEYKRQLEQKNKELDEKYQVKKESAPTQVAIVMPYDNLPDPAERAELCYRAVAFAMQQIAGWNQTSAECGNGYASANFQRNFGTLDKFYEGVSRLMPGAEIDEKSESEIEITAKLPVLNTASSMDERDGATVARFVNNAFQHLAQPVDVGIAMDQLGDVSISVVEVAAKSKLTPPEFIKIFDGISGVYMTLARWDARGRTWNYEVIIYAK
jgi:hypothetical protein